MDTTIIIQSKLFKEGWRNNPDTFMYYVSLKEMIARYYPDASVVVSYNPQAGCDVRHPDAELRRKIKTSIRIYRETH